MDIETLDAIRAAEVLKEYCGYTKCKDCPFYYDFRKCLLVNTDVLFPADWEVWEVSERE